MKAIKSKNDPAKVTEQLDNLQAIVHGEQRQYERKTEFFNVIQHDLGYLGALEGLILSQKRLLTGKDNKVDLSTSRIRVEHFETLAKHAVQKNLVADKFKHYKEIFVPNFDRKMKLAKKRWEKTILRWPRR